MRTFKLRPRQENDELQDAWNEFHKTPKDFARVNPYFVRIADSSIEGKIDYAKFLMTHDRYEARDVFLSLRDESSIAVFYLAHCILWPAGQRKLAVHFYRSAKNKGHYVASIFYPIKLFFTLNWKYKLKFSISILLLFVSAFIPAMKNARMASSQL